MIKPTIGRVVWYRPAPDENPEPGFSYYEAPGGVGQQPCKADIAYVWNDRLVNLMVVDHNGVTHSRTSVQLLQDGDVSNGGHTCEWMPFQVGQAKAQTGSAV